MDYELLRLDRLPTMWCEGCGIGIALKALLEAISDRDKNKSVIVSGIGCAGRAASYVNLDSIHTLHGRAIPVATGIKLANPDLKVIVFSGDGDLFSIGGNHLIHAARKNIDILVIAVNNNIYAMTGGQMAPTTPKGMITRTTPYGNVTGKFDVAEMLAALDVNYAARWTTYHVDNLVKSIKKCLDKEGFCYVEVVAQCPTVFGVLNNMPKGYQIMEWYKWNSIYVEEARRMDKHLIEDKIVIGEFAENNRKGLVRVFQERIQMLRLTELGKKRG
ncbi:MAG: thiamine pyrophosphate-dependent enzyme [Methanocellales archaeon]